MLRFALIAFSAAALSLALPLETRAASGGAAAAELGEGEGAVTRTRGAAGPQRAPGDGEMSGSDAAPVAGAGGTASAPSAPGAPGGGPAPPDGGGGGGVGPAAPGAVAGPDQGLSAKTPAREDGLRPPVKNRLDMLSMKNAAYVQIDHGVKEGTDQRATVIESIIVLRKQVAREHAVTARFHGAIISSASYDLAKERGVMVSGATTRIHNPGSGEIGLGWIYHPGEWSIGISGTLDFEYFYRSRGVGVDVTRTLFDDNTTLSLLLKGYNDIVRLVLFDGSHDPDQFRNSLWVELGWTQILTPISLFNLTLTHVEQSGFLGIPFQSVLVARVPDKEVTPSRRSRNAATIRYKQALGPDEAVELGYRNYFDDWGVHSHTLHAQMSIYLRDHSILLEPLYRYHLQEQASFFARDFSARQTFMSSDPDLGSFSGHMFSLNAVFIDVYFLWLFADYDVGLNYYHRTDGLDMLWMTMGFDLPI